jgi:hypothetical protein
MKINRWLIFYRKEPTFRLDKDISMETLSKTHVYLAAVSDSDGRSVSRDAVFSAMQAEVWSPNGEGRNIIRRLGLKHTSMSVGDVLVAEILDGNVTRLIGIQVDVRGWKIIPEYRKPKVKNFGTIFSAFSDFHKIITKLHPEVRECSNLIELSIILGKFYSEEKTIFSSSWDAQKMPSGKN